MAVGGAAVDSSVQEVKKSVPLLRTSRERGPVAREPLLILVTVV